MLKIDYTTTFKKDFKRCKKRGYNMELLKSVIDTLAMPAPLPPENKDHGLSGNLANKRECHILSDWLLEYRIHNDELVLYRTGTHSDLFGF